MNPDYPDSDSQSQEDELAKRVRMLEKENKFLKMCAQQYQNKLNDAETSRKCPKGHQMRYLHYQYIHQSRRAPFKCKQCKSMIKDTGSVCWRCEVCKTNTCINCSGMKVYVCPYGHGLTQKHRQDVFFICHVCMKQDVGTYYQCPCQFTLCPACETKQY